MDAVPGYDVRKSYLVLFQFGLHLAPAGRLYRFQETGQQFFLCGLTETFSAEVFDDRVHVSLVDRTEPHAHGLLVDYRNGDIYIVGPVEIGNDATRKIRVGIAVVVHKLVDEIERLNILQADFLAMQRAYNGLGMQAGIVLVDGNQLPQLDAEMKYVIKGDARSASIAAASILAKVSRDRYMKQMAEKYPQYGFEKHKGYGTKAHYAAVDEFGLCEIHRKSFFKKYFD